MRKTHLFIKVFSGVQNNEYIDLYINIQIVGGNLAGFDNDNHSILILILDRPFSKTSQIGRSQALDTLQTKTHLRITTADECITWKLQQEYLNS